MATLKDIKARYPGAVAFRFGDSRGLNKEILDLVRAGKKTVTCDALAAFDARGEDEPDVGRIDIACDWDWTPVVAIRTVEVLHIRFDQMPEVLVAAQGEFRDLADWRAGYQTYLTRNALFALDVVMLVERFEVIEDFGEMDP